MEADPFLEKIKKGELTAEEGIYGARIGIGGGFGMSEERQPTPNAVAPLYNRFRYTSKDGYVDIKISHKDVQLARTNTAALIDTVQDAMAASYDAAKWNVGRMLFGDGTGLLANATASVTTSSAEITVDDTTRLIEGLVVDLYAPTATTISSGNAALQIIGIDHQNKKVLLSSAPGTTLSTADSSGNYAKLYVQNSRNREITGLGKIFAPASTTTTDPGYEIYGVTKSDHPWIVPFVIDAEHDISDVIITNGMRDSTKRGGEIDMIMAGIDAFNAYEYYMRETANNVNIVDRRKFLSGAAGYDVMFGNRIATVVCNEFVPASEMWCVDSKQFELRQTGWDFATHQSTIFTLMPDTSVYRALLANYMELVCKHPGTCVRITNADAGT